MNKIDFHCSSSLKGRIADSRNRLYRVALAWCGDEMLADDLTQETMATGIKYVRQLRDETRLFAWLYSILNNSWRQHLRRKKCHEELDEEMPGEDSGPMGRCHEQEVVTRVRRAVAQLPRQQRQVISLVDLEEFSYCDVAAILEIPIGTVMSRLHRARRNLIDRLGNMATDTNAAQPHIRAVK